MRVLWFSPVPSLYDEKNAGTWVAALETAVKTYNKNIELGIAFEHEDKKFKEEKKGVAYYPVNSGNSKLPDFLINPESKWKKLRPLYLNVINDFKPDIIQCFGSEWAYGLISKDTKIPVVIHMQGFLNMYHDMEDISYSKSEYDRYYRAKPLRRIKHCIEDNDRDILDLREREIMKNTRYFMGRTGWDKSIVKYYGPENGVYYYCPEAIRQDIYDSAGKWTFNKKTMSENAPMKILSVINPGVLKGSEMILRCANYLKDMMHFDFEWRIAMEILNFDRFELKTGIKHEDVNVKLLGSLSAAELAEELRNAEVFVLPSIIDNSPNSLCEAQLIGTPVIASNVGGISSLVKDGETGILYPYNEYHTLAFKLIELHGDREKLEALSLNEKRDSLERHDPEKLSHRLEEIYGDILEKCSGS